MAETTLPRPEAPSRLDRFAPVERWVHWANATLFAVVMATAAILYVGPLSVAVGRRALVRTIHVYVGLALPLPWLIGFVGRWRAPLLGDAPGINPWSTDHKRGVLAPGRARGRPAAQVHPGRD